MASPGVPYPADSEYHPLKPPSPPSSTTTHPNHPSLSGDMDSYSLSHTGGRPPPSMVSGYAAGGPPRTPSPTPSDIEELKKGAIDFKKLMDWRTWAQRKYLWYYVAAILGGVVVALVTIYHKQIVEALTPASQYLLNVPGGWSIPIGIMFVLSFPPLFGNEIVHVLCGIVWGIWIGFGIVCAGTFLGEIGNFYAFRYCCTSRGEKLEKNNLSYACLAKVVREGGFLIAVIIRLSAIPGHFTTAVFSTCGMGIISFALGAFLSLPKQFATVYIGVIIHEAAGQQTTQQRIISAGVLILTTAITIFAAWWVWRKMNAAKPAVLAERRKARAMALYNQKMYDMRNADLESPSNVNLVAGPSGKNTPYDTASSASSVTVGRFDNQANSDMWPPKASSTVDFNQPFNTSESIVNLPLSVKPQRWDANGRAVIENQPDFGDGSQYHGGMQDQNWSRRPPPPGAKMPSVVQGGAQAQQYVGSTAPPDIRVIRASGASTYTNGSITTGRMPYDSESMSSAGHSSPQYGGSVALPDNGMIRASGVSTNTDGSMTPGRMPYDPKSMSSAGHSYAQYAGSAAPPDNGMIRASEVSMNTDGTMTPGRMPYDPKSISSAGNPSPRYGGSAAPLDIGMIRASGVSTNTDGTMTPGRMPYDPKPMSSAGNPSLRYGGPAAPLDIRVIRASGVSTNTDGTMTPGRMPYDPKPTSPAGHSSPSSPQKLQTSPTRQTPPQGLYRRRPSGDSGESSPQWTAGVTKEDDNEAAVPLTTGLNGSRSVPPNIQPSYPPPSQPPLPQIVTPSTSHPATVRAYEAPASPYDGISFYNPYDRPQQQPQQKQQPPQEAAGRNRREETDATAASYHTAEGTTGSPRYGVQQQLPPPESRQQQTPSPPGGFGAAQYPPVQYGGGPPYRI